MKYKYLNSVDNEFETDVPILIGDSLRVQIDGKSIIVQVTKRTFVKNGTAVEVELA